MVGESFDEVHARLRALLEPYAPPLFVTADGPKGHPRASATLQPGSVVPASAPGTSATT